MVERQGISHAVPDVASLARLRGRQVLGLQVGVDLAQPGTVIPQDMDTLRQTGEELPGMCELFFVCLIKADDDVGDVAGFLEFLDDLGQGRALDFGIQARQYQRHRTFGRKLFEFGLHLIDRASTQFVQRGDGAVLKEVHDSVSSAVRVCRTQLCQYLQDRGVPARRPLLLREQRLFQSMAVQVGAVMALDHHGDVARAATCLCRSRCLPGRLLSTACRCPQHTNCAWYRLPVPCSIDPSDARSARPG